MQFCTTNDAAAQVDGWRFHTPQPDDPPPASPDEPDVPPIGDPPPEPDELPHTAISGEAGRGATGAPGYADPHKFCVLVTRRPQFLPAV